MKIGIVSDTHSNLHALRSVLGHMQGEEVDIKVHLGDIIGYATKPNETLALTLKEFNYIVKGDHDLSLVEEEESWGLSPLSKEAIAWTREKLSKDELDVLSGLEYGHKLDETLFVHGSPHNPLGLLVSEDSVTNAFYSPIVEFQTAFVGHTQVPYMHTEKDGEIVSRKMQFNTLANKPDSRTFELEGRNIINVGATGQPRDGDPRASYAIYDTDKQTVTVHRIPYSVDKTVGLMQRAGFSDKACERLIFGR